MNTLEQYTKEFEIYPVELPKVFTPRNDMFRIREIPLLVKWSMQWTTCCGGAFFRKPCQSCV